MAAIQVSLAIMKAPGHVPGGGYHYMLYPAILDDHQAKLFSLMGYVIVKLNQIDATRLVTEAGAALKHQMEVALLTEGMTK